MAAKGGVGIEIETDKVPLRESGMEPWEIMISESQERMLAIVEPEKADEVLAFAERYELVGAVVGRVADHGDLRVIHDGEVAGTVPAEHLADAPVYERDWSVQGIWMRYRTSTCEMLPEPDDYNAVLLADARASEPAFEASDLHPVRPPGRHHTVILPGADAAVMRIKGTKLGLPLPRRPGPPLLSRPARRRGGDGRRSVQEPLVRRAEAVAVTDCLNFGSPEKPDGYYQLAECIEGMAGACEVFRTPVVSGNVSLFNETDRGAIYPTPTVGMVGVMKDVKRHATSAFKREGDMVVIVGGGPHAPSFCRFGVSGGGTWRGSRTGFQSPTSPKEKAYSDLIRDLVERGLVDTAHDMSGGGELLALAEMAISGGVGFEYDELEVESCETTDPWRRSSGRKARVSSSPCRRLDEELEDALGRYEEGKPGIGYDVVGRTGGSGFKVENVIDVSLEALREAYERDLFERHAPEGGHIG